MFVKTTAMKELDSLESDEERMKWVTDHQREAIEMFFPLKNKELVVELRVLV